MTVQHTRPEIEQILKNIIADNTGDEEIYDDSDLQEDLGIDPLREIPLIVHDINKYFSINLNLKHVRMEIHTFAELVDKVTEDVELG